MSTSRVSIAADVDLRMKYLLHDTLELALLLKGERLSPEAHEDLTRIIADLQRVADRSRPVERKEAA